MVNKNLLLAKALQKGLTAESLADKIGIHRASMYRKLNGETDFKSSEVQQIIKILGITTGAELKRIFFEDGVTEMQQR